MLAKAHALPPLLAVNLKMFYRSRDTILFWVVSPLLLFGIYALVRELEFGLGEGAGTVGFFSFVAIGNAAFIGAHFAQDGTVGLAAGYRAQGVLKRIAVTPISAGAFIAAQILARLVVALAATVAILGLAVALGADLSYTADLALTMPLAAIAVLIGVSFGFALAGAMPTPETANQLNIALGTIFFLLAGVMYPLQGLPGALPEIAEYAVPFAAQVEAFRDAVAGESLADLPRLAAISLGWLALAFAFAVRAYRFVERAA